MKPINKFIGVTTSSSFNICIVLEQRYCTTLTYNVISEILNKVIYLKCCSMAGHTAQSN